MTERCLMAASLAVLVFHPSLTIKCFKPTTKSPERQRPTSPSTSSHSPHLPPKVFSKSKSKKKREVSDENKPKPLNGLDLEGSNGLGQRTPNTFFQSVLAIEKGEPAMGVVENLFRSGWTRMAVPVIKKVLRVHNTVEVVNRFEGYRGMVKLRAAEMCGSKWKERCVADGNEVLRYHGTALTCCLGHNENFSICGHWSCGACSVIGFSCLVRAEAISFYENSRNAHMNMMEHVGNSESITKAMLICRVISGRVANCHGKGLVDGEDGGFDSMLGPSNGLDELIIMDSRAVLPCFVVIYSVE